MSGRRMTTAGKNIMLGTAGHVDHGKTALVKILTGCDTDRLAEEKARGLTIELGFAPCQMRDERIVGIVDVPGHVGFIRNMVAGAHGIDVVILVVAADDSVMPQTREHLDILTLMGTRHGLIALTKIDLVDAEMRQLVEADVREFVSGTFLADAAICPVSNITGEGFDKLSVAMNDAVAACEAHEREQARLFRLWIERAFPIHGFGAVVSGIPTSGEVRVGDRLEVVPGGQTARVRGLEVYGHKADLGRAGECAAINLADMEVKDLARGKVLCEPGAAAPVAMVEAELRLLPHVPRALKDYAEVHLHIGTAETMAKIALLEGRPLAPGGHQLAQLRLSEPLGVAPGDRFVIRGSVPGAGGGQVTTIGGGQILDTGNVRLRRGRPWVLAALEARREAIDSPTTWCAAVLAESGTAVSVEELARRARMRSGQVRGQLEVLRAQGDVLDAAGGTVVHGSVVTSAGERIVAALEQFHAANPKRLGLAPGDLSAQSELDRGVYDLAAEGLLAAGRIERHGETLALAGRVMKLSPEDQALCEAIERSLREAGLAVPLPQDLAAALGAPMDRFEAMVRVLVDQGTVVRLDPKVILHSQALQAARNVVLDLFRKARGFTTMEFRDALGASRKYAVPVLDYFDSIRLTARSGNRRTPGAAAKELL